MFYFPPSERKNLNHLREEVNYWYRPIDTFVQMMTIAKEENLDNFSELGKEKYEILIGSLFLIALEKAEGKVFWIGKVKKDPPDFVFMTLKEHKSGFLLNSREVEITRNIYDINLLINTILEKDKKYYPQDTIILCYIESGGFSDLKTISNSLIEQTKNTSNIFVLFHGCLLSDSQKKYSLNSITLVQLSTIYQSYTFEIDLDLEINTWSDNPEKLIYTKNGVVFYGKREGEDQYPLLFK